MCCETKTRIAATVRELMQTRPVSKITVQDVMQRADMTRQSFYYHFQDIYDVLEWDVRQELENLYAQSGDVTFETWCSGLLNHMWSNQSLYRKRADALGREKIQQIAAPYVRPSVEKLLLGSEAVGRELTDDEIFALDFVVRTIIDSFLSLVFSRTRVSTEECVRRVQAVVTVLRGSAGRSGAGGRYAAAAC